MEKSLKMLILIFAMTILSSILAFSAFAAIYTGECGANGNNVTYKLNTDTGDMIISGKGDMMNYSSTYNRPWHDDISYIKRIKIYDGVTSIGNLAFYACRNLTGITFPNNQFNIGHKAFENCKSINNITIPKYTEAIGGRAFYGCSSLSNISITSEKICIYEDTFYGTAYYNNSLNWSSGILYINNCLIKARDTVSGECVIKEGTTVISAGAFKKCENIESIIIPKSVYIIGPAAFEECVKITNITIPENVIRIGNNAFEDCINLSCVILPNNITVIESGTFARCNNLRNVTIGKNVTTIGNSSFSYCDLYEISIPSSVKIIEDFAFYGCSNLTKIKIPDNVERIGSTVFNETAYYNDKLNWENSNILYINNHLITADTGISGEYTIREGTKSVAGEAFKGCSNLTKIVIPDGTVSLGNCVFSNCSSLESALIPDSVIFLGYYAFYECSNLKDLTLSDKITDIGDYTFYKCQNIKNIIIPNTVKNIGAYSFSNCDSINDIIIPNNVISIGEYAFHSCDLLSNVTIGDSTTVIGDGSFGYCNSLKNITIPLSVKTIGNSAIRDCPNLEKIIFFGTETAWEKIEKGYYWIENHGKYQMIYCGKTVELSKLTDLDYLAMSSLSYHEWDKNVNKFGTTIKDFLGNDWNKKWDNTDFYYSQIFSNIENWTIFHYDENKATGFACYVFENEYNEFVIAYRGSSNALSHWNLFLDPDWLPNDIKMLFGGFGEQILDAFLIYEEIVASHAENIAVTGHSLGGGLSDIIAACYNCIGASFNSAPFLDIAYWYLPEKMAQDFAGIDTLFTNGISNYKSHVIENDLVGDFQENIKLKVSHKFTEYEHNTKHDLNAFVISSYNNAPIISSPTKTRYNFGETVTQSVSMVNDIVLATLSDDKLYHSTLFEEVIVYCGDGDDTVTNNFKSSYIIGGTGDDVLDGGSGNDNYLYFKGNGKDTIIDCSGDDRLLLRGFDIIDEIVINAPEDSEYIDIICNGEIIISIYKYRSFFSKEFTFDCSVPFYIDGKKYDEAIGLNKYMKKKSYTKSYTISCPVMIEILDSTGNVVYTLKDETTGNFYTEYGNFYVYEEENCEYGKRLDIIDGYSFRIIGTETGTMDIYLSDMSTDENPTIHGITNVPVNKGMKAIINEADTFCSLNIDYGVGENTELELRKAHKILFVDSLSGETIGETYTDLDGTISEISSPTKEGYVFGGWFTQSVGGEKVEKSYTISENITLYAHWNEKISGDIDSNGNINIKDIVVFAQYLAGWNTAIDKNFADCNGDGEVNIKDLVLLAQYLAGWNVTLG